MKQKSRKREDLTTRENGKEGLCLVVWIEQREMELMKNFETEGMLQGIRRSDQKGQALERFKEVERHLREVRKENHPGSHILERDDQSENRGADTIGSNCHSVSFVRKDSLQWKQHRLHKLSLEIS